MKRFLQIGGGKNHLPLLRKRTLATLAALLCMMALMPTTARAETINIVSSHEELTKTSTVYVGEVVVDGVSMIKYLYSSDVTLFPNVRQNLLDGLNGMVDGDYATLLQTYWPSDNSTTPQVFAFCSDSELAAEMNENWSSALYVGTLYFPDKPVKSEINSNLYDIDNGFKAAVDAQIEYRMATIDTIIEAEKSIVSYIDAFGRNIVYYKVVDGEIIKYVHTLFTYSAEATTVMYTKVELETPMTETPLTFEAVEAGTINIINPNGLTIEYNKNNTGWTSSSADPISIAVAANDVVAFRGNNSCYWASGDSGETPTRFTATNPCYVYGNVMSLVHDNDFATNYTLNDSEALAYLFAAPTNEQYMFYGNNTTLQNHPNKDIVLPATTVPDDGYMYMFAGCQGLTRAPQLPATTIGMGSYHQMFADCAGLVTVPEELPATTLGLYCYDNMFFGCTSIEVAPSLPATTLANGCYMGMFTGCTSLSTAPALPATTLAEDCYHRMFEGCTSLIKAPDLPAATLFGQVYGGMFDGCTSLNYVKCLATDISADYSTVGWMYDVAPTGTFVKAAGMTGWTIGEDGIPEGWTVETINVFTTDGNWDEAANWSGNAVPADGSNVVMAANATIPANYVARAGEISINDGATLTIADGGQLYHNNTGVMATVEKNISAYNTTSGTNNGWHLIGYSFAENGAVEGMTNLLANEYDLYYYDEPTHYWKNYKNAANNFTELEVARGYLYANSQAQTIGLKGTLNTANATVNVPLAYTEAAENLKGFNLVGNPFAHNVTTFAGANVASEVYRMNETMDNLMVSGISAADPLLPGEGFFVKATADDASITFNAQTRGESKTTELVEVPTLTIDLLQDGLTIDRLVVKHEGEPLEKFTLRENGTRIFATEGGKDYAVVTVISSDSEANQTEIPVNFKAAKNGTYTISVNLENTDFGYLHLIDNLTGTDVDLLAPVIARNEAIQGTASYTFHAKTTDYASRFRLVFSVCGDANSDNEPFAYLDAAGNIIVNGGSSTGLETLQVVDVVGRVIVQGDAMNRVSTSGMTPGIYVLRLINGNDVRTQKIVVR